MSTDADDIMLKKPEKKPLAMVASLLDVLFRWHKNTKEENESLLEKPSFEIPDSLPFVGSQDLNNQNERDELDCNPEHKVFTVGIKGTF